MKNKDLTPEQLEKKRAARKKYEQENKERLSDYRKEYYRQHREEYLARAKKWREEHREYFEKWREDHADYQKEYYAKRKAEPIKPMRTDICPSCGSKEVGKVAKNTWYCRDCCVEFTNRSVYVLTKQGIRLLK